MKALLMKLEMTNKIKKLKYLGNILGIRIHLCLGKGLLKANQVKNGQAENQLNLKFMNEKKM